MKLTSTTRQTITFYWRSAWRYPRYLIGLLFSIPLTILASQYLPPLIVANVLNRLTSHDFQPHHIWASFGADLVGYVVLLVLGGVVGWRIVDRFGWRLEGNVERDIARRVFSHLITQSPSFHADHFGGSLVSQTNKLMGGYVRFADTTIFQVIPLIASLLFTVIILIKRAPLFVLMLLLFSLLYIVSSFFVTRTVRRRSADQAAAESAQTGLLADAVTNVVAIKSFAHESFENKRFARATDNTHRHLLLIMHAMFKQQSYFGAVSNTISGLALTMVVIGVMVFHANLATLFLILSYTSTIVGQLLQFSNNSLRNYNRAFGDASDMVKILQIEPAIKDPEIPESVRIKHGSITLSKVDFRHDEQKPMLFAGLSLRIKPGEKVGLVGPSGGGKTTLTSLLLRFMDIDGGEILIDGQNIADIRQADLRRHISYVPQEPLLFHRTLRENIQYGDLGADNKAIEGVAKLAHAHDFIRELPEGYKTLVGERGIKLSGGQRQRIAIARAMLKNAPILLLDEATSALDSESEVLIQDALWKLMEGRTAIVIAHRLSTIQKMDRIVVLKKGTIVEQGSHKELLRAGGTYAKLWAHQSGGFMED